MRELLGEGTYGPSLVFPYMSVMPPVCFCINPIIFFHSKLGGVLRQTWTCTRKGAVFACNMISGRFCFLITYAWHGSIALGMATLMPSKNLWPEGCWNFVG